MKQVAVLKKGSNNGEHSSRPYRPSSAETAQILYADALILDIRYRFVALEYEMRRQNDISSRSLQCT
jgi:hypothetical protein